MPATSMSAPYPHSYFLERISLEAISSYGHQAHGGEGDRPIAAHPGHS